MTVSGASHIKTEIGTKAQHTGIYYFPLSSYKNFNNYKIL